MPVSLKKVKEPAVGGCVAYGVSRETTSGDGEYEVPTTDCIAYHPSRVPSHPPLPVPPTVPTSNNKDYKNVDIGLNPRGPSVGSPSHPTFSAPPAAVAEDGEYDIPNIEPTPHTPSDAASSNPPLPVPPNESFELAHTAVEEEERVYEELPV